MPPERKDEKLLDMDNYFEKSPDCRSITLIAGELFTLRNL